MLFKSSLTPRWALSLATQASYNLVVPLQALSGFAFSTCANSSRLTWKHMQNAHGSHTHRTCLIQICSQVKSWRYGQNVVCLIYDTWAHRIFPTECWQNWEHWCHVLFQSSFWEPGLTSQPCRCPLRGFSTFFFFLSINYPHDVLGRLDLEQSLDRARE